MRFTFTTDADEFADRTAAFVEAHIECNVLATVLSDVCEGMYRDRRPRFAYGCEDDGRVGFAALRTPPWPILASGLSPSLSEAFVRQWMERDGEPPGVNGERDTSRSIAAAWGALTGGRTRCRMRAALHTLEQVTEPPRPAAGELRLAILAERELLIEWMELFVGEAGLGSGTRAAAMGDARPARGRLLVWCDGAPVSMVGLQPAVAGVVRLGPVYTPVEHRRRGYAGSAVAAVSRQALSEGASSCMLFTDLANPTSNKIYAQVGYRRQADWEEHEFTH
jgi:predicted GNAT family acetyltransferase